jgi:hypothetical protein
MDAYNDADTAATTDVATHIATLQAYQPAASSDTNSLAL